MNQDQIEGLIDKFDASNLTELRIETDDINIIMKSQKTPTVGLNVPASTADLLPTPVPVPTQPISQEKVSEHTTDTETITSPIVGTFYRTPSPDAPPFVDVGSKVKSGASLCIIEAMKVMNKLEAEFPCEILNILAESGHLVEFGAPLFEVKRL